MNETGALAIEKLNRSVRMLDAERIVTGISPKRATYSLEQNMLLKDVQTYSITRAILEAFK